MSDGYQIHKCPDCRTEWYAPYGNPCPTCHEDAYFEEPDDIAKYLREQMVRLSQIAADNARLLTREVP